MIFSMSKRRHNFDLSVEHAYALLELGISVKVKHTLMKPERNWLSWGMLPDLLFFVLLEAGHNELQMIN
jgi:hypothetical protein